ncbi:MAG: AEC family transporter [Anaerostipes sp.]|nr:AEC family transporter [Anaerostipes sp.]MDD3745490.1 AEC family transporter [Anaerostipes sp.]
MEIIYIVSTQILKMFLMMAVGLLFYKIKFVTQEGSKALSNVALYAVVPCVVFSAFQVDYTPEILKGLAAVFVLGFVSHLIPIFLSRFMVRGKDKNRSVIEKFALTYPNCGFMGIPIAQAMYGNLGVIYITAFISAQNVLVWSQGISLMRGGYEKGSWRNIILAPVMVATFFGILFFLLQIRIPELFLSTIQSIGGMNTPLAMIVAGVSIGQTDIWATLKQKRIYYISFMKLIVIPLIILGIMIFLDIDIEVKRIVLLGVSAPTAAVTTMFAVKFDKDVGYAAELFALITLFSVVSMSAVFAVAGFVY